MHGADQAVACFGGREIDNINKKPEHNSFILEELKHNGQSYKNALGIGIGRNHVCVIESSQSVSCITFADATSMQSAQTIVDTAQRPVRDVWQLRARGDLSCGLTQESGSVLCWGNWKTSHWPAARAIPTQGKNTAEYIQIAITEDQICGVRGVDRSVYCTRFGESSLDQIELRPLSDQGGRTLSKILMITAGAHHFCAINEDSELYCWGSNDLGQLGFKPSSGYQRPTHIHFSSERLKKLARVSAGDGHTCVTTVDDPALFCFGESFFGGSNSSEPIEYPL